MLKMRDVAPIAVTNSPNASIIESMCVRVECGITLLGACLAPDSIRGLVPIDI